MGGSDKVRAFVWKVMEQTGMNAEAIGKKASISPNTVRSLVKGLAPVSMNGADKLLGAFGYEIRIGKKQKERGDGQ